MKTVLHLFSLSVIACLHPALNAAEAPATPEDILFSAHKQFRVAGNYSWTEREGTEDRLTMRRKRLNFSGKTQINGFTLFSLPVAVFRSRAGRMEQAAALGKETVYKVRGRWLFYSEVNEDDRNDYFMARVQSKEEYLRPLPHELLAFALAYAKNIRRDANDILADLVIAAPVHGVWAYINLGGPLPLSDNLDAGRHSEIELRVGIDDGNIVEFTLDFNPSDVGEKKRSDLRRYFWEISDIGTTTLDLEPGVDVMLKTLQESTPARRR